MEKREMNSKGLTTIVATIIIILLTLVGTSIAWIAVREVILKDTEQVNLGELTLKLNVEEVQTVCEEDDNRLVITIKREVGEGDFTGLNFVVDDGETSETFTEYVSMEELEVRTFVLVLSEISPEEVEQIKIYPIFELSSGKESIGKIGGEYTPGSTGSFSCVYPNEILNIPIINSSPGICGDGNCDSNYNETCSNCPGDCGVCAPVCGDGVCNGDETCLTCPGDCGTCISTCMTLNTPNTIYALTQNVTSTGACFYILAENVTLNCQGNWITYSTGGLANKYGIYSTHPNTVIKNCNVLDGNLTTDKQGRFAIYTIGSNITLINNMGKTNLSSAIYLVSPYKVLLINNTGISTRGHGIYINSVNNGILTDNTGITDASVGAAVSSIGIYLIDIQNSILTNNAGTSNRQQGIFLDISEFNTLINNTGKSTLETGIEISRSKNTLLIKNFGINTNSRNEGILVSSDGENNTLINNIGIGKYGIVLGSCPNNTLIDNNGTGINGYGIYLLATDNNLLINNTVTGNYGFMMEGSENNILINNTASNLKYSGLSIGGNNNTIINQKAKGVSSYVSTGIQITGANNTMIRDCISVNGELADVIIFNGINNTFLNCSYDTEDVRENCSLIREWYYRAQVKDSSNNPLSGVDVAAFNNLGVEQFSKLTDSSGWIERQEVIDYVNLGGTRTYYSNYNINATGYTTANHIINFTSQNNKVDDLFIL